MTSPLMRGMARATELTRAGKLNEATDLIRALLAAPPGSAPPPLHPEQGPAPGDVIDGQFTRVDAATADAAPPAKPRVPLSETLRRIARGGMPAQGRASRADVPIPPGAQFLSLTHSGPQGSRAYRLYVPAHRPSGPLPLIVMLHGCTQSPEDFAAGTRMNARAEEAGCLIAYPAQPAGANAQKCWNWFRPEDQGRDRGELALIAGIARDIRRDHGGDPARTYAAGLSAGGAAAALLAAACPDLFAAVGVHSGLPAGSARDVPQAFAAMRSGGSGPAHRASVPTIVFHGTADTTVHPANGASVLSQALPAMPALRTEQRQQVATGGRQSRVTAHLDSDGRSLAEHWEIEGAGHAWAGGSPTGSYTDPAGPDASAEMIRFFLQHRKG